MNASIRPLAVVTGASSGIGPELARECANWITALSVSSQRFCRVRKVQVIRLTGASLSTSGQDFSPLHPDAVRRAAVLHALELVRRSAR
jgi:NADP-dependent 3-hydroxy acid dehydrogenase YdfG